MVTKLLTPRTARWLIRAGVLACAAVWWLLVEATGAVADDGAGPSSLPIADATVGTVTDAADDVADAVEATTGTTTAVARDMVQHPAVHQVAPAVAEPVVALADHADTTTHAMGDTIRSAGATLGSVASSAVEAVPAVPSAPPTAASPGTHTDQAAATPSAPPHAQAPTAAGSKRDRHLRTHGPKGLRNGPRVTAHRSASADVTADLVSSRTPKQLTDPPSVPTVDRPGLGNWLAGVPLGSTDDAGHPTQGSHATGGAVATLASGTAMAALTRTGLSIPRSSAVPSSLVLEHDSTPD